MNVDRGTGDHPKVLRPASSQAVRGDADSKLSRCGLTYKVTVAPSPFPDPYLGKNDASTRFAYGTSALTVPLSFIHA